MSGDVLCKCGCGEPAPIANQNDTRRGWVRGQPLPFKRGHNLRVPRYEGPDFIIDSETGCHVWRKGRDDHGYGIMTVDGKNRKAHIVYYERKYGPVPDGKELDHVCRNRPCCNADHLEPVPHHVNVWRGLLAKITLQAAQEIRRAAAGPNPPTPLQLAETYGISRASVYSILKGHTWRESRP